MGPQRRVVITNTQEGDEFLQLLSFLCLAADSWAITGASMAILLDPASNLIPTR
jgi:hypothetical protein